MIDRLESVRRKLQDVGRLQSSDVEMNVATFDTTLIEKISKVGAFVTIVEEDAKVASARDVVASAASLARQTQVEKDLEQTSAQFECMRLQVDIVKAAVEARSE